MAHSLEQRIQAAVTWLTTGSFKEASQLTGIPERTIRDWANQPWWTTILEEAKDIKNKELDGLWTQLLHVCSEQLKDRITNGDVIVKFVKGEVKTARVPLDAKDLAVVLGIAADKREKMRAASVRHAPEVDKQNTLEDLSHSLNSEADSNS